MIEIVLTNSHDHEESKHEIKYVETNMNNNSLNINLVEN